MFNLFPLFLLLHPRIKSVAKGVKVSKVYGHEVVDEIPVGDLRFGGILFVFVFVFVFSLLYLYFIFTLSLLCLYFIFNFNLNFNCQFLFFRSQADTGRVGH